MRDSSKGAVWSLADALAFHRKEGAPYSQFFEVPEMSAGIYTLAAGSEDGQAPHVEDEIYYVIAGKADMFIDGDVTPVEAGATIFVAREVEHRFQNITEDMTILVIFAPRHDRGESDRRRSEQNG
jgi:mannose-6-phosphate isomerase-like protein (cupin superfamily)